MTGFLEGLVTDISFVGQFSMHKCYMLMLHFDTALHKLCKTPKRPLVTVKSFAVQFPLHSLFVINICDLYVIFF